MKIIELSSLTNSGVLPATYKDLDRRRMIKFNPAIVSYDEQKGLFLLPYRVYVSYNEGVPKKSKDYGTPWSDVWTSRLFDGTAFALLKVSSNGTVECLDDVIPDTYDNFTDLRITHHPDSKGKSKYHVYYTWIGNKNEEVGYKLVPPLAYGSCRGSKMPKIVDPKSQKKIVNANSAKKCIYMESGTLTMRRTRGNSSYSITDRKTMCPGHHNTIEKNWSYIQYKGYDAYHYGLTPWFFLVYNKPDSCVRVDSKMSTIFSRIADYYGGAIHFSGSTPFKPFKNGKMLSVSHIKIDYLKLKNLGLTGSKIWKFLLKTQKQLNLPAIRNMKKWIHFNQQVHDRFVYVYFFFTVDPETLELDRFSDAFLPCREQSLLTFVSGLERFKNNYLVTYGRDDVGCEMAIYSRAEIDRLLVHTNRSRPTSYDIHLVDNELNQSKTLYKIGIVTHPQLGFDTIPKAEFMRPWTVTVPKNRVVDSNFVQSDMSVVKYLQRSYPDFEFEAVPAKRLLAKKNDKFDMLVYTFVSNAHFDVLYGLGKSQKVHDFIKADTRSYPNYRSMELLDNKSVLYKVMRENRIPIAQTFSFKISESTAESVTREIQKRGWEKVILKAATGFENRGIKVLTVGPRLESNVNKYMNLNRLKEEIVAQEFIGEFTKHLESCCYYVGNELQYVLVTNANKKFIKLLSTPEDITRDVVRRGYSKKIYENTIRLSKKVMKVVSAHYAPDEPGYSRVDIGCCISGKVFLNEIELVAGFFSGHLWNKLPLIDAKIGDQIVKVAKARLMK